MNTGFAETSESIGKRELESGEMVAIAAAVATALFGSRFRIRSIESHVPQQRLSRWTQQGRTYVQASHNLKRKR